MRRAKGYAFNQTRQAFLATELRVADTHWARLRGLMATSPDTFPDGHGLWIVPCHGVHTMAMRYPIDVIYLNHENVVVHIEEFVKPWTFTRICMDADSVIELRSHTVYNTGTICGDQIEITFEAQGR